VQHACLTKPHSRTCRCRALCPFVSRRHSGAAGQWAVADNPELREGQRAKTERAGGKGVGVCLDMIWARSYSQPGPGKAGPRCRSVDGAVYRVVRAACPAGSARHRSCSTWLCVLTNSFTSRPHSHVSAAWVSLSHMVVAGWLVPGGSDTPDRRRPGTLGLARTVKSCSTRYSVSI
jgi:hypothetical protein